MGDPSIVIVGYLFEDGACLLSVLEAFMEKFFPKQLVLQFKQIFLGPYGTLCFIFGGGVKSGVLRWMEGDVFGLMEIFVFDVVGLTEGGEIEIHSEGIEPQLNLFPGLFAQLEKLNFFFESKLTTHNFDK